MKRGNVRKNLLIVTALFLCLVHLGASAEAAGVTLKNWTGTVTPRASNSDPVGTYEYVLFGRYPQLQKEATPLQPILWRVLSADQTGDDRKALLFSDKNLDTSAFGTDNNYGTSAVRTFLVGADADGTDGIFNDDTAGYFSMPERDVVSADAFVTQKGDGSGTAVTTVNPLFLLSKGQLNEPLFGFLAGDGADDNRIGVNTVYTAGKLGMNPANNADWFWSRSPSSGGTFKAWDVTNDGLLLYDSVLNTAVAVRPACFINLEPVIFKSGSNASPSAGVAGSKNNPYLLYLPVADVPAGSPTLTATVSGNKLTLAFAAPVAAYPGVFHAYQTTPNTAALKGQFTVSGTTVDGIGFSGGNIVLTLGKTYRNGETGPTVAYAGSAPDPNPTDGIGFMNTGLIPTTLAAFGATQATNVTPAPTPEPPTPSSNATPGSVSATVGDEKVNAEKQTDGKTYLITVPYGTDISNLPVNVTPPAGGSVSPDMPVSHDFTKGPLTFTITAENGSKKDYTITVKVADQEGPKERALFTINVNDYEIIVTQNADGTLSVKVRIPFAAGSDPALLDTIKMIASSLGLSNISYVWVDGQGKETPVARMAASAPYLEIRGTAANMDAIKDGVISKIEYTLSGDNGLYAQTFANGLKVASMPGYPTTPMPAPSTGGSSSGCDAGMAGLALLALAGCVVIGRNRKA